MDRPGNGQYGSNDSGSGSFRCIVTDRKSAAVMVAEEINRVRSSGPPRVPFVVGIGGSVAVGKSTLAAAVASQLTTIGGERAIILGTDGFLFPNARLLEHGSIDRKGEPDTYNEAALLDVIADMRSGRTMVRVPTYSHRTFDVGDSVTVTVGSVVIVEGVNALQSSLVSAYDVSLYLHADEGVVRDWYVERFIGLIEAAEVDDQSYYRRFVDQSAAQRGETARLVWDSINAPNLHRFVAPTRELADVVVHLDATRSVLSLERRRVTL